VVLFAWAILGLSLLAAALLGRALLDPHAIVGFCRDGTTLHAGASRSLIRDRFVLLAMSVPVLTSGLLLLYAPRRIPRDPMRWGLVLPQLALVMVAYGYGWLWFTAKAVTLGWVSLLSRLWHC
jgi:hypothetical protein